ncbi:hypothetical protein [Burkholderia sp. NLJ2]|uniref:hypothetical protein n=1 Tax=Burkholderia sp. NLJ2 TaxID=3090699 RepID=UPI003C6C369F
MPKALIRALQSAHTIGQGIQVIRSSALLKSSGSFVYASYRCTSTQRLADVGASKDGAAMTADKRRSSTMFDK